MFEDVIRALKKMERGMTIEVPIKPDDEGFLDKECPSKDCLTQFKVHQDDWGKLVRDEEMFCPVCGHSAAADQWITSEQNQKSSQIALATVERDIGKAFKSSARKFNRRQSKNAFLSMTMNYKGHPRTIPLPPEAADPMKLKIKCGECGCRYAVIGAGFFCPACGHNSVEETFSQSMNAVREWVNSIELVRRALAEIDKDNAERTVRMILEKGVETGVMSFQRMAEALYLKFPAQPTPRRNAFQNLNEGSGLWNNATGKGYDAYLTPTEFVSLRIAFQQRHLLAHREGMVDTGYIQKSGDTRYAVGQRIVIKKGDVTNFIGLLDKLISGMRGSKQR